MPDALDARLLELATAGTLSDDTPCRVISVAAVARLATDAGLTGRQVEIAALENRILPDRYLRNRRSLSESDQIKLLQAAVCIVGLGGLGGMVTETLARLGIGRLTLLDGDTFEAHNLNRQLLSEADALGSAKADAAAMRVKTINPGLEVTAGQAYLTADNASPWLENCELVVDCLDTIRSRFVLEKAAKAAGIPMISAAVAGISGHVTTIFPGDHGLETIYGPEAQLTAEKGEETRLGCLAPGVNLIASLECAEVLKVLLGKPNSLRNRLLVIDLSDYTVDTLQLV
jgi:molybdopterin/thiamine biosynthesis adenylyltransferase